MEPSELSPFPYHGPLEPDDVVGRDELVHDLTDRIAQRRLTALLGPRRYGKTSVLRRVCADLGGVGYETVWVDLYELGSMADLAGAIDQGLAGLRGRLRRAVESIAGTLSLRIGFVGVELGKTRRERPDPAQIVRTLLQVIVHVAQKHQLVVVFDEFSGIASVRHGAGTLRTQLQHHYRDMGIVFAGSQPSTMSTLFGDRAQPFFAQADLVAIGPLTDNDLADIVTDRFEATGRDAGEIARVLAWTAEGHPQRAMQLADALWRHTPIGATADEETWRVALAAVRADVDSGSERLYSVLAAGHQKTLRAVAAEGRVFGRVAEVLELSPGSASNALDALVGDGLVVRRGDVHAVVDPLFADWIRRRFPIPA